MSFLLDSHTLLWAISDQKKLSSKVIRILEDGNNEVFVSAVTFWEISLKYSLGKLDLNGITPEQLPKLSEETGFSLLPLLPSESSGYYQLAANWHRDPFDRMLIWQAITNNLTLLSKDKNVEQYKSAGLKVVW
ncbi:type II toxin-antitoxin system VapC family toxin [Mucilaginibacter ginsenosidivorax]|uniref:Type II toxin-antitoxin system VapC family toxin n=1 Tax=Mucilaginibacter ginsenosidivorax TaxID=862126 RepID=A0A5B8VW41_9SPHI|nr:type II toxin-antitoxin system VapC family toxin [Mucilaginibacter ginsenosidivorax]QEC75659.1 type II toxin-antitoxin system VapC family toxin [Mucilaginibacter ginsenosidivorax]